MLNNENKFKLIFANLKPQANSLTFLTLENLKLGVSEAAVIKTFIQDNNKLAYLNLYGNVFGVEGAILISDGLKTNSTLELIDLGCNRIRNKGATALANATLS